MAEKLKAAEAALEKAVQEYEKAAVTGIVAAVLIDRVMEASDLVTCIMKFAA